MKQERATKKNIRYSLFVRYLESYLIQQVKTQKNRKKVTKINNQPYIHDWRGGRAMKINHRNTRMVTIIHSKVISGRRQFIDPVTRGKNFSALNNCGGWRLK